MIKGISNISSVCKYYKSYNHTLEAKKTILYPKNIKELKKIIIYLKSKNIKVLIKTGNCGHGDKTKLTESNYVISLKKINKIKKINKKNKSIDIEAGINLFTIFKYLEKRNFKIFNIPGGKNVSLGGAISGNVHGRPLAPGFSVFGDNIISLKILNEKGKILNLNRNNKLFFKVIGGLSLFGIILEAKIKIFKLQNVNYHLKHFHISNKKEFKNFNKKNNLFYGYINFFNKFNLQANFMTIKKQEKADELKEKKKSDLLFKLINIFKIDTFLSFFINNFILKIFYYFLFLYSKHFLAKKKEVLDHERNTYFVNINTYLPYYFRKGMIEIQFSIPNQNIVKTIKQIKSLQFKTNVFPIFFILKKMDSSKGKYIFNFPKYNYCISLGFSKKINIKNDSFFKSLYKLIYRNQGNLYVTKDETFLYNNPKKEFIKYCKKILNENKTISSDFKEKLLKI